MTRIEDDVLILVLDGVEFLNHLVVAIIERNERDHLAARLFEPRVRLNVLQHRFSDGPGPAFDLLLLPHPVELLDYVVGDVETRSLTVSSRRAFTRDPCMTIPLIRY